MANIPEVVAYHPAHFAQWCSGGKWRFEDVPHLGMIANALQDVALGKIKKLMIFSPPRHGKLVSHDTPVPTPRGFVPHGDLRVGDEVFGPDGSTTRVVAIGAEDYATRRVQFTDGEAIDVHPNHEWRVYDRTGRTAGYRVMETWDMARAKLWQGGAKPRCRMQVDYTAPLDVPDVDLPVDPYTLGLWLGDGTGSKPAITHDPRDVHAVPYETSSVQTHNTTGVLTTYYKGLWDDLLAAAVVNNKHIPHDYLWASAAQRWALLEGLIDSDGCVGSDGRVRFVNANARLVADVEHLVRSFGYRTCMTSQQPTISTSGIEGKQVIFTLGFSPYDGRVPARLERKRKKADGTSVRRRRGILAVEKIDPKPGRCIQVEREDGLYLVGHKMVPTHNSELISRYFPAWYIGASLTGRVILTSYEADFAASWGRKARDVLEEHGQDIFNITVSKKSAARDWWELDDHGGAMMTAGVGGAILGKGADVLVTDDPIKNAQDSLSKTKREQLWDWYLSTARTRLEPGGSEVLIMQRWHEDDLAGRLLEREGTVEEGGDWTLLTFRALAEEDDILGRNEGEALWPERFPREVLEKNREGNSYFFSAQYQQRPQPLEGGLFQKSWIRYFYPSVEPHEGSDERVFYLDDPEIPTRVRQKETSCFFTVDLATSQSRTADYTVISVFRSTANGDLLIEDVLRRRMPLHDQLPVLMRLVERYRPYAVYMEKTGFQLAAVQAARQVGLPVIGVDPRGKGPKEARAIPAAERMRSGKIYLKALAAWNEPFIEELLHFPTGRHDDQVDTLSMAAENVVLTGGGPMPSNHDATDASSRRGPYKPRQLY